MEITIKNKEELKSCVETLELDPTATVQDIVRELLKNAREEEDEMCTIKIHMSLVAPSYVTNGPVFARQLISKAYPHLRSVSEGEWLEIKGTQKKVAVTFRGRVILSLQTKGVFVCDTRKVPVTYRIHPKPFTAMLEACIEKPVRFTRSKKKKQFTWKTNKK